MAILLVERKGDISLYGAQKRIIKSQIMGKNIFLDLERHITLLKNTCKTFSKLAIIFSSGFKDFQYVPF